MPAETTDFRSNDRNRQIVLKRRPHGAPVPEDFEANDGRIDAPQEGQVLMRTIYLSLDPYMRGRMNDGPSYAAPWGLGEPCQGRIVGEVVESRDSRFRPGDLAFSMGRFQQYCTVPADGVRKLDPAAAPLSTALGTLGFPGLTAYVGLANIGQPKAGETVVVSAATGAVGAVACQLAQAAGARVVGIAGGERKCAWLRDTLKLDAVIDHKVEEPGLALDRSCPEGIDVYFENVGGAWQDAAFARMRTFGRMVMCGMISGYNDTQARPGPNLVQTIVRRLRIEGFVVGDHAHRMQEFLDRAIPLLKAGRLHYLEDVVDGLEAAPAALIGLLEGRNFGKQVVKVGSDPTAS
ncbi:NADP-dependent oxidoreductase [Zavarzinia sp. CC-PAN008]|uniref:NADP-dependent oxidoreductase n=1 Tax=Zavarzinia sp. CC-PAN008 TaxID=3243332 RepID=UPI003F7421E5